MELDPEDLRALYKIKQDVAVTRGDMENIKQVQTTLVELVKTQNGRVSELERQMVPLDGTPQRIDRLESEYDKAFWPRRVGAIIVTILLTSGVGAILGLQAANSGGGG